RGREPSSTEEAIIARTARILYIPSTEGDFPDFEDSLNDQVVTRDMLTNRSAGQVGGVLQDASFSQEGLARFLNAKRDQGLVTEIFCPIIFHEYVVGYIYLASTDADKVFDDELVKYVSQFSRMLAYSLKINHYFKDMDLGPEEFNAKIVDLSASGLLFAHNSRKLKDTLMIYADVTLALQVGDRRVKIVARVMRKFEDKSACFYGVQFLDMAPEDFRFVFDLVYGRPFTKEDNELWEGGAPPPPLEL
ncbi:MAG TPA: PilZ domain-containing protein, partial [Spirochaetia bacterium]|nr:PilZ domain-containing protein [Spirochaetia bacterium]